MSTNASIIMSKTYAAVQPKCIMEGIDVKAQINDFWDDTEGDCQYEVLYQNSYNTSKSSKTIPFWNQFVEEYNIEPFYTGIGSYEAVYMLGNVTFTNQSLNSYDIVTKLEEFNRTNPFNGPSGKKAFWPSHDLVNGYPYGYGLWCQWHLDGKKVVVPSPQIYPAPITTGKLSLPYWGVHNLTVAQDLPGNFTLSSNADSPDNDGTFDLFWSNSNRADNYSVFVYDRNITYISKRFTLSSYEEFTSPFTISGLMDGDYYYVVVAYNETGETLSNNVYIKVRIPPGQFVLSSDAELPDTDGSFNLTWTNSARATSYSIFQYSKYITIINESLTLIGTVQATNSSFEITGLDIGFYYYIVQAYNGYDHTESNCIEVNIQFYDEITGYWELAPFVIDDTGNGHYNWAEVVNLPWCSGSGTSNDPYIIEFIKIDGNEVTSCITIRESDVFFTMRNSSFFNAGNDENDDAGIKLMQVSNGTLLLLNSSRNNANGIVLDSCQYINITSCSVNYNSLSGILLIDSNYTQIINNTNTISYNEVYGIRLIKSHHNNITNNIINNNNLIGIYLDNSDFNLIDWNNILGNGEAILDHGQDNYIGDNNITSSGGYVFPFDIFLMVLIITIAIFVSIGAAIIVKKRISISRKEEKEISETKKEKIKIKLEEKLRFVDHLIKENQIKLAYKNLGKVKDTADRYGFFAIFNQANKKVEICKDIEAGIYREVKREAPVMPVATEKAKEEKETIPVIEKRKEFKVFLSYSTLDSDRFQIDKIVKHLEKFTEIKKLYYYTKDSGQNIVEYMEETLSVCNIFVLFCSRSSKKSKAVTGEWQSAYQLVKRDIMKIIPVYEDEDDVPILLIPMLNIRYEKENFKGFINKLYQEILR